MAADSTHGTSRRRALYGLVALAVCGFLAAGDVLAERGRDGRGGDRFADRFSFPDRGRARDERETLRDERRQRRLSDEQRQQLRRDIDEAGRDIYRRPRRLRDE